MNLTLALKGSAIKRAPWKISPGTGLVADGWVGDYTWKALMELVSFEAPIDLLRWLNPEPKGRPKISLKRAIALRLHVLGLAETRKDFSDAALDKGMAEFGRQ